MAFYERFWKKEKERKERQMEREDLQGNGFFIK